LCLSKGRIESFGRPIDLIQDQTSIFHELIYSLDPSESKRLIKIALRNTDTN
jgi:hypothetical protein